MARELAERFLELARMAEQVADLVEAAAQRGDAERRLAFAAWERATAQVARHNAAMLRSADHVDRLDPLPPRPEAAA